MVQGLPAPDVISVCAVTFTVLLLSDCPLVPPSPSSTDSILRQGFPLQSIALASNLPHPVSLDAPFFSYRGRQNEQEMPTGSLHAPTHDFTDLRLVLPTPLSLFQVDGFLPSIWHIWVLAIGKWHWPPSVLRSSCFLSEMKHLGRGNKFMVSMLHISMWMPEYKSHFSLNRFQDVSNLAIWPMFFSHRLGLWVKNKYFHFPISLVFLVKGGL